jgi:hypothetical protein
MKSLKNQVMNGLFNADNVDKMSKDLNIRQKFINYATQDNLMEIIPINSSRDFNDDDIDINYEESSISVRNKNIEGFEVKIPNKIDLTFIKSLHAHEIKLNNPCKCADTTWLPEIIGCDDHFERGLVKFKNVYEIKDLRIENSNVTFDDRVENIDKVTLNQCHVIEFKTLSLSNVNIDVINTTTNQEKVNWIIFNLSNMNDPFVNDMNGLINKHSYFSYNDRPHIINKLKDLLKCLIDSHTYHSGITKRQVKHIFKEVPNIFASVGLPNLRVQYPRFTIVEFNVDNKVFIKYKFNNKTNTWILDSFNYNDSY